MFDYHVRHKGDLSLNKRLTQGGSCASPSGPIKRLYVSNGLPKIISAAHPQKIWKKDCRLPRLSPTCIWRNFSLWKADLLKKGHTPVLRQNCGHRRHPTSKTLNVNPLSTRSILSLTSIICRFPKLNASHPLKKFLHTPLL